MNASAKSENLPLPAPRRASHLAWCMSLVPDPRVERTRKHLLCDILVAAVCAVLCGHDSFCDMEEFARSHLAWLRLYVPLANGVPSHDTFRRVLSLVEPRHFLRAFRLWTEGLRRSGGQIAIDGKASRRARNAGERVPYLVNAWSASNRLMLGGERVSGKENEIAAIPRVLGWLDIRGALVSADAIACQKKIAALVRRKGGDYLLALKDNHSVFRDEMQRWIEGVPLRGDGTAVDTFETRERAHGRDEWRRCRLVERPAGFDSAEGWQDLACIALVETRRSVGGKPGKIEKRLYICSRDMSARDMLAAVRAHWGIESAHWVLDVVFGEDYSRARTGHAMENLSLVRRLAANMLNLERDAAPEGAPRQRHKSLRRRADRDDAFRTRLLLHPLDGKEVFAVA